jgi:hypothetical protein
LTSKEFCSNSEFAYSNLVGHLSSLADVTTASWPFHCCLVPTARIHRRAHSPTLTFTTYLDALAILLPPPALVSSLTPYINPSSVLSFSLFLPHPRATPTVCVYRILILHPSLGSPSMYRTCRLCVFRLHTTQCPSGPVYELKCLTNFQSMTSKYVISRLRVVIGPA